MNVPVVDNDDLLLDSDMVEEEEEADASVHLNRQELDDLDDEFSNFGDTSVASEPHTNHDHQLSNGII